MGHVGIALLSEEITLNQYCHMCHQQTDVPGLRHRVCLGSRSPTQEEPMPKQSGALQDLVLPSASFKERAVVLWPG